MEKRIMLLALLPMLIVSGVDGCVSISISGGAGEDRSAYGGQFEIGDSVGLSEHLSSQGSNLANKCEFKGAGVIHATETASDDNGDSVTLASHGFLKKDISRSWDISSDSITGTQILTGDGRDLSCFVQATNRDGLKARVKAGVGRGSIAIQQIGTASETGVDSWQKIKEASGSHIKLSADASDELGTNRAYSGVTVDHDADLLNYNSEALGTYLDPSDHAVGIDFQAAHGAFNAGLDKKNHPGSISGYGIHSDGFACNDNQNGLRASYSVTIDHGSIAGRFDSGTETKSNGGVIAVPLESPAAWSGYVDKKHPNMETITIYGDQICSNDMAKKGILLVPEVVSHHDSNAQGVNNIVKVLKTKGKYKLKPNWAEDYGFAEPAAWLW